MNNPIKVASPKERRYCLFMTMTMHNLSLIILLTYFLLAVMATTTAFVVTPSVVVWNKQPQRFRMTLSNIKSGDNDCYNVEISRREVMTSAALLTVASLPQEVFAAAAADNKPKEFVNVGTQAPAPAGEQEFITLQNGVKIKDYRIGNGNDSVTSTSTVFIQCSGRLLNLNGVVFYNTKNNNPDGFGALPLQLQLGQGQALPGLESGLVGMKKGGVRRIIIPAQLAYDINKPNLEPKPMNDNDQRALDSVLKNPRRDATILLDVSLERFK